MFLKFMELLQIIIVPELLNGTVLSFLQGKIMLMMELIFLKTFIYMLLNGIHFFYHLVLTIISCIQLVDFTQSQELKSAGVVQNLEYIICFLLFLRDKIILFGLLPI